jgi:hypothetical protein
MGVKSGSLAISNFAIIASSLQPTRIREPFLQAMECLTEISGTLTVLWYHRRLVEFVRRGFQQK